MRANRTISLVIVSLLLVILGLIWTDESIIPEFDSYRAYQNVAVQLEFGPRTPGSDAHAMQLDWMQSELENYGWNVDRQEGQSLGHLLTNLIAKKGQGNHILLLGAHYDSRLLSDKDRNPENRAAPVLGANDGASGVAVLMELARVLPEIYNWEIWIVFFDLEDNGQIDSWNWILGSTYFAENLSVLPDQVVIVDMVGDRDLFLSIEGNSDPELAAEIWNVAQDLGFSQIFSTQIKNYILDDHLPFRDLGIPAVDIIDIEYPYWHTSEDTLIQVSPQSLDKVGVTLLEWILRTH